MTVKNRLNYEEISRTNWDLYRFNPADENYFPKSAKFVVQDIDRFLSNPPKNTKANGLIDEFSLIKKYQANLKNFFNEIYFNELSGSFLYNDNTELPIHFALFDDKSITLIISSVYIKNIYNTLELSSKQRATKVLSTYILPSLNEFVKHFPNSNIQYFAISCIYGSKDFSNDSELNIKPEFLAIVVPAETLKKYVDLEITEEALVNSAEIFLSDRNMVTDLKKIEITID
tara:strand:+ start:254 stop:943 length:690 start_codon:yes stop_codon:yes gene_type:complete